jgi:quercetin dioxygenase-like cupin family protein
MRSKTQMARMLVCVIGVLFTSAVHAQNTDMNADHVLILPGDIKWMKDANPAFLPGMKMAVIDGNPASNGGLYTVRLMFPNGYKVMPHFHPADENITVLKGTFMMGIGDTFDEKALMPISEGGYMSMKKGTHHYAMAKGETVIQVHGIGPFILTYVNPGDDPRNKK